jgi:hypothetical protein
MSDPQPDDDEDGEPTASSMSGKTIDELKAMIRSGKLSVADYHRELDKRGVRHA